VWLDLESAAKFDTVIASFAGMEVVPPHSLIAKAA
jgi:hypothetical protein